MTIRRTGRKLGGVGSVLLASTAIAAAGLMGFAGSGSAASADSAPSYTSLPVISGTAQDNQTLTTTAGAWTGTTPISFAYRWYRCDASGNDCAAISGATDTSYRVTSNDVGHRIRVAVTAQNSVGSNTVTSAATSVVIAAGTAPKYTSLPVISGTAQDNQTLTATAGGWTGTTPISFAYRWYRCDASGNNCAAISGATSTSYRVTSNDVGHRIRIAVTATNSVGSSTVTSGATAVTVAAGTAPKYTSLPVISGTAHDNQTLTATAGGWTGTTPISFAYRWYRCDASGNNCAAISGATSTSYRVTSNDVGHRIRIAVTATNSVGSSTVTSGATAVTVAAGTAPKYTSLPVISGTAHDNQTLTATAGGWTGTTPISFAYRWYRCDASGNNCAAISGATSASYRVTSNDVGHRIRIAVTATNSVGSSTVTSGATAVTVAAGPAGAIKLSNRTTSIPVTSVSLPNRLTINRVVFTPRRIRSRAEALTARFRVVDSRGYVVRDALVYAIGVPANRVSVPAETKTDQAGWATIVYQPLRGLPMKNGALLSIFVRARKPGENVLRGVSTRRIVSIRVHR